MSNGRVGVAVQSRRFCSSGTNIRLTSPGEHRRLPSAVIRTAWALLVVSTTIAVDSQWCASVAAANEVECVDNQAEGNEAQPTPSSTVSGAVRAAFPIKHPPFLTTDNRDQVEILKLHSEIVRLGRIAISPA